MKLKQSVWNKAKSITSFFEGGDVTPNFDGQGISMGILQWNLGQGTLNPILNEFFLAYPNLTSEYQLIDLKNALVQGNALDFAKRVINGGGTNFVPPWKTNLTMLNNSPEFQAICDKYCNDYINRAISLCQGYNLLSDRTFCLMFDICVQCGSIPVIELIETLYLDKLTAIAKFSASRVNPRWQSDVLERKLSIVDARDLGKGWNTAITFDDQSAFEDDFENVLGKLTDIGVIQTPEYWEQNCIQNGTVKGDYVNKVILRFVSMYKIVNTFDEAVDILQNNRIISSPDYWKLNAHENMSINGVYAKTLLTNMSLQTSPLT